LVLGWMVVIDIVPEFKVVGLRKIASVEGLTIAASTLGKTEIVIPVCAVAVLIGANRYLSLKLLANVLLCLLVISARVSAAQYFFRFWGQLDDRIKQRRKLRMNQPVDPMPEKAKDAIPS